ncbi:hypothetical protein AB0M45_14890 [Nocardia sp. NPDC051787]|uniref:Rv0361 family membrane protein n=1 Tax=Nocardia sp. NPDC051787 TaxID=3155415 RepID=UPI0034499DAD
MRFTAVGIAATALVAVVCSSTAAANPGSVDPATVAREYVEAIKGGESRPDLLCAAEAGVPDEEPSTDSPEESATVPQAVQATLGAVEVKGDEATFDVTVSQAGEDTTTTKHRLIKEGGAWKVCGPA